MTDTAQNKKYYVDKIKMASFVVCIILCLFSMAYGMIWESQTQTLYAFSIRSNNESIIASEENCTNVGVGKNQLTYEKDGVQSTIVFPADVYVKTDVRSYEQNSDAARKSNTALACSFATYIPIIMLGVSISAERS